MSEGKKRFITTIDKRLADRCGFIGSVVLYPNKLTAVIRAILIHEFLFPMQFHYCGSPDERLRKKFNIPEPKKDAYE